MKTDNKHIFLFICLFECLANDVTMLGPQSSPPDAPVRATKGAVVAKNKPVD